MPSGNALSDVNNFCHMWFTPSVSLSAGGIFSGQCSILLWQVVFNSFFKEFCVLLLDVQECKIEVYFELGRENKALLGSCRN